jgi:excisionase family DNA binding protein
MELPDKRYYRPDELARIIEEPLRLVYRWLENDKIKHIHHGRKTMIPRSEIDRILSEGV